MPNLKFDERMQRCEFEEHDDYKRQKYYIVRSYSSEIERHFCFTCCQVMSRLGHLRYDSDNGFVPTRSTEETLLNIYGINGYYKTNTPPKLKYNKDSQTYRVLFAGQESDEFKDTQSAYEYVKNINWTKKVKEVL